MTPEEILTVEKEATNTFGKIAAKPIGDDMPQLNQTLHKIILNIPYDQVKFTHNLSGLISPFDKYIAKYGTSFQRPKRPKPYSPTITATMSDEKFRKSKATHTACKEDYILYKAVEMGIMRFFTTNVDEKWYR